MNAHDYQEKSKRTIEWEPTIGQTRDLVLINAVLGLIGEWNELIACNVNSAQHVNEMGDCWWYLAAVHSVLGLDFSKTVEAALAPYIGEDLGGFVPLATVAEMVKKGVFHRKVIYPIEFKPHLVAFARELINEANMAEMGLSIIWQNNVDKLRTRYPDGFEVGGGVR